MRITSLVIVLVTAAAFAALGQEGTIEDIKHGAKKAGETVKDGLETVGEKAKETAEIVGEKTKEAWRDTKAYASSNRVTYRKGARQKLNALSKEITDLKSRRSEATDPQTFDSQLDTLTQQQATANLISAMSPFPSATTRASSLTRRWAKWKTELPRRENNYVVEPISIGTLQRLEFPHWLLSDTCPREIPT